MTPRVGATIAAAATLATMLAACGGSDHDEHAHAPTVAELVGSYDVHTAERGGSGAIDGVGVISAGDDLRLALTEPPAALTGSLRDDGTITFTGYTTQTDVIGSVEVTGKFEVRDGTIHFVGVRGTEVPSPLDLVMERPEHTDLRRFGGRHRLHFDRGPSYCDCSSSLELDVVVDAVGLATVTATAETRDDGSEIARLSFLGLAVAPSGRFQLEATYARPDGTCPLDMVPPCLLVVDGMLSADDASRDASATLLSGVRMQIWNGGATVARIAP